LWFRAHSNRENEFLVRHDVNHLGQLVEKRRRMRDVLGGLASRLLQLPSGGNLTR
jgi:hypothetical protein